MAITGSIQNQQAFSFEASFDKTKMLKNIEKEIKPQAEKLIREHIKRSIKKGIIDTQSQILSVPTREGIVAPHIIAGSLNAYQLPHVNQHVRYKVGSYARDDKPETPTGARGSRMTKRDKSLTTLYEEGSGKFKMEGTIGAGSIRHRGHVSDNRNMGKQWKRAQEASNKIVVAEKGYGKGIPYSGKSSNRGVPMITHPGYEKLGTMQKLRENILHNIRDTTRLEFELEDIKTNMKKNTNSTKETQTISRAPLLTTKSALKRR